MTIKSILTGFATAVVMLASVQLANAALVFQFTFFGEYGTPGTVD